MAVSPSTAMSFIVDYLRKRNDAPYADVQAAAKEAGHAIYPVMYGRAKALLGLIPVRRRAPSTASAARVPRGGGRKTVMRFGSIDELKQLFETYRQIQAERDRYRAALEEIAAGAKRVLG